LPRHKGLNTHKRAIEAGDKHHGCTVHWVSPGVDEGAIIANEIVPVLSDDTEETLSRRVLIAEHKLYPKALDIALKHRYGA
jgi:phosphoribosylglycinamide formyltransferase-1